MSTFGNCELRQMPAGVPRLCRLRDRLLADCGLGSVEADYCVGCFDADDNLLATASLHGDVIKGVAVHPSARDMALMPKMLSNIISHAAACGIDNPKVFTKPEYAPMFRSLSFTEVGRAPGRAVMLELSPVSLADYKKTLAALPFKGRVGVIVMHANPLTRGHLYLIEQARRRVDTLVVIPVGESGVSEFTYVERRQMLADACRDMAGVVVAPGSHYAVSRSSFPSYFIKEVTERTDAHIELDLDIFARHIAPALGAVVRFVGSEPADRLTARYNELMHRLLPARGIEVEEIARVELGGEAVSASRLRRALGERRCGDALAQGAPAAVSFVLARAAAAALTDELDTTPKPGLVDRDNNGAHTDMDYRLMRRSIDALRPVFARLAGCDAGEIDRIRAIGLDGERLMLEATGGVNTHRGALFSLGLAVVAAATQWRREGRVDREGLRRGIMEMAANFPRPEGTHGAGVAGRYGVATALDAARGGFPEAFAARPSRQGNHVALLDIMSRLEDSNIYHRCGADVARQVKEDARALALDYSTDAMKRLDADYSRRNISPGGAADMLALALLVESLTDNNKEQSIYSETLNQTSNEKS